MRKLTGVSSRDSGRRRTEVRGNSFEDFSCKQMKRSSCNGRCSKERVLEWETKTCPCAGGTNLVNREVSDAGGAEMG